MLILRPIAVLGRSTVDVVTFIGGVGNLIYSAALELPRGLISGRGRRMGWRNVWAQMVRVGVRAIPIVSLVLFCIGAILALQMAPILAKFGVTDTVADIISIATFRELGPLVAAIVLTGFAGASIAAEMGTMVVSEEIEAMEAHAITPARFLVLPRIVATTVMMVCLTIIADIMGLAGGMTVGHFFLDIDPRLYLARSFDIVMVRDFLTGLVKAGVFGVVISGLACYLGLGVTGGAQGVGVATTRTVVLTIVALIFIDLLFTAVFYYLGW